MVRFFKHGRGAITAVAVGALLLGSLAACSSGSDESAQQDAQSTQSSDTGSANEDESPVADDSSPTESAEATGEPAPTGETIGVDDGTTLTLWTRAPLERQAKQLVDAYNASHRNQVDLVIVPNDD